MEPDRKSIAIFELQCWRSPESTMDRDKIKQMALKQMNLAFSPKAQMIRLKFSYSYIMQTLGLLRSIYSIEKNGRKKKRMAYGKVGRLTVALEA